MPGVRAARIDAWGCCGQRQAPSYLAWFYDNVDGNEGLKGAILALPGFSRAFGKSRHQVRSSFDEPFCIDPRLSRADLDRLCWEILHLPEEK